MTTTIKIKATAIKALLLLLVLNLAFSCSNNKNNTPKADTTTQNAATNETNADSTIVIKGTVRTVTFGKDGYTAEVQTETEGSYAALVSIVNVGGPENYRSCSVGDDVTFKGAPFMVEGAKHLKVEKIIGITSVKIQTIEAKYRNIEPDEYCWQSSKVMDLHTAPSSDSKVEGKHFAGETLKVLGTKIIDNQLWVNITYRLSVKAGYEDRFPDGKVMSSGSPTGWIGGVETPEINCK